MMAVMGECSMSIVSLTWGECLSVPQERCSFLLGSTYAPAAHRQHVDSRTQSQGEAGGGEGQPAKDCWEICFVVCAGLQKADVLYYPFLSGFSTYVGVRENAREVINQ